MADAPRKVSDASTASDSSSVTAAPPVPANGAEAAAPAREYSAAETARSDERKDAGNALFAAGKYGAAVEAFTEAIEARPTAALYSNRAFAQLRSENYGSAIADADAALALDPAFVKAYYRRGAAHLALSKYKAARADFRALLRVRPGEKDAAAKLAEAEKAIRRQAFEAAIATEATKPLYERLAVDIDAVAVDPSYAGPVLPPLPPPGTPPPAPAELVADPSRVNQHGISLAFVRELISEYKAQRGLHRKYSVQLLLRVNALLRSLPSLVRAPFPPGADKFNVCGDTHGQYYDTLHVFELAGEPSPTNPYLFNGDFVDRGSFSLENVMTLFAWKLLFPDSFHLTRGNHEQKTMNRMYGFEGEVKAKLDETAMHLFSEVFQALPLAAVIDSRVLVVHGGLFQRDGVSLEEIAAIPRFREPPEEGLMSDLLWSDPQPFPGRGPSKRGVGQSFGPDVTAAFLAANGLQLLIRSHEVMEEGYQVMHGGKLVTVFSAPRYCDVQTNKGAICVLPRDASAPPSYIQYDASPHPNVKPMQYAAGAMSMWGL